MVATLAILDAKNETMIDPEAGRGIAAPRGRGDRMHLSDVDAGTALIHRMTNTGKPALS